MHLPLFAVLLLTVQAHPALDSASVARVLTQLKASDSTVCALAGQALTNYGGFWGWAYAEPGMPMPRGLKDSDPEVRVMAAWALGEIEDDRGVTPLVAALKDSDIDVRTTAAWALGEIESPLAREGLTAAQNDESGSVRRAATWALRQLDDDDDPRVRVRVRPRIKIKS